MSTIPAAGQRTVPLLDLRAQYATIKPEIDEAVARVMSSQHFIGGPEITALEERVAAYSQCRRAVACASGTDAILIALWALGIGHGDEVIVPSFTFFATAGAVANVDATPVFVDVDPRTFNITADHIAAAITERTKAVIVVHLFGQCADMDPIINLCRERNMFLIEDAAQAIGAEDKGRRAGSMSDIGTFSFFPSKNLGCAGDGGMMVTQSDELADRLRLLCNHGAKPKYYHKVIGTNSRLDALNAAILRAKLNHLDAWSTDRQKNARRYNAELHDAITTPFELSDRRHIYNQYVIQTEDRDGLQAYLKQHGIGTEVYYPLPLHRQECFQHLPGANALLPVSERLSNEVLALPIYPELHADDQQYVISTIADFLNK